ncbi:MAG: hypothetical protein HUJ29_01945 [Gammaproteobacteria bacterium]|nr:hypothetical protein [Gammaproteobacteria bacterium]
MAVLTCAELGTHALQSLFNRFGLGLRRVGDGEPIPGSWFGEPEAGVIQSEVIVRGDTPVHSALHEGCHLICMDAERRQALHTNVEGDYDEENAVCFLQILLADHVPGMGRERMWADMDEWGYSFRLGSARAWFERDAEDARQWLLGHGLIDDASRPTWRLR